jgi:hypothetical protein
MNARMDYDECCVFCIVAKASTSTLRWESPTFAEPREVPSACHCFPQHMPVHPRSFTPDLPLAELPRYADYYSCGQVAHT